MKQADIESLVSQSIARALAFQHAAPAATAAPTFLTTPSKTVGGGNGKTQGAVTSRSFSVVPAEFHGVKGFSVEKTINGTIAKRKFVTTDEAAALVAALKR